MSITKTDWDSVEELVMNQRKEVDEEIAKVARWVNLDNRARKWFLHILECFESV